MLKLTIRRVLATVPMMLLLSVLIFGLVALVPGDPAVTLAGENPTPEQIASVRAELGLDDPFPVRYWDWLLGILSGDFGTSLFSTETVAGALLSRLPATLSLAFVALAMAAVLGLALGIVAGLHPGTAIDRVATITASAGVALPYFWVGMMLVLIFAIYVPVLPAVGYVPISDGIGPWFAHLVLPATALALAPAAVIARQTRAAVADVMTEDYVRTARAKGLPPRLVVGKHALKNAAIPVATAYGIEVNRLIGGTVVVEQLFSIPGIGQLAYQAVFARDFPVLQGVLIVTALIVLIVNLAVDVSYGYFNPRIRQA